MMTSPETGRPNMVAQLSTPFAGALQALTDLGFKAIQWTCTVYATDPVKLAVEAVRIGKRGWV